MPPKERGRIDSNVDTASQHPKRSTVTSVAKSTSPPPTAITAGEDAHKVEFLSLPDSAQPSDKTKSSQSVSQQQQVVSRQLQKFLVTCLVVAGVGWLLVLVGICTDHWVSFSASRLHKVGQRVTDAVDIVTEAVDTLTEAVSTVKSVNVGVFVSEAVSTSKPVTTHADTVRPGEVTQTADVTDDVTTRKPSPEKDVINVVIDIGNAVGNAAKEAKDAIQEGAGDVINTVDAVVSGNKSLEEAAGDIFTSVSNWFRLGTDRVHIGLFDCGMDCDGWMMGVQTLILSGLLFATTGMVLMTLHLVLKGRKPWMPTVGGVSCLIGGIFTVNGVIASFLTTPYFDEPEWSFLVTFIGGLLFMVAGVLVLLLQRYDRIQSRSEG